MEEHFTEDGVREARSLKDSDVDSEESRGPRLGLSRGAGDVSFVSDHLEG